MAALTGPVPGGPPAGDPLSAGPVSAGPVSGDRVSAGPVPGGPARRVPNRKAQLAELAADLFRRHGYHQVGVQEIAAAAGLTGPAVYRHFRSKQEILAHVLLAGIDAFGAATEQALSADAPPADRVRALTAALARLSVERRETTALWRWQRRHLAPADQAAVVQRAAAAMDRWAAELRLVRPELDGPDAELLCWAAMSVFGSVAVHHASLPRARFAPMLAAMADAVLASRAVPAPPGAPVPAGSALNGAEVPPSRREAVLAGATRLFRERGYHAVSMEDIGAAVGIAGPSVYRHFASKAELLCAACTRMADRLATEAAAALSTAASPRADPPADAIADPAHGPAAGPVAGRPAASPAAGPVADPAAGPAEALDRLVRSYVGTALAHRDLLAVYAADSASLPEQHRAELVRLQRRYVGHWVDALRAASPGLPEAEARIAVHAGLTVVNDLVRTHRLVARPRFTEELLELTRATLSSGGR